MNIIRLLIFVLAISTMAVNGQDSGFSLSNAVGVVRATIAPSLDGKKHAATMWAPSLFQNAQLGGKMGGKIASVSSANITVANADWSPNQLSGKYLYIKSGSLSGVLLRVVSNTATTLALDSKILNLYGNRLARDDLYQIIKPYTILEILGAPADGVVGGSQQDFQNGKTDRVVIRDEVAGFLRTYYYDTTINHWRDSLSVENRDAVVIPPMSGSLYYRISQETYELSFTGNVPIHGGRFLIPEGVVSHSRFFPLSTTLDRLGLQLLPQWRKSNAASESLADRVMVQGVDGIFRAYWHNGKNWVTKGSTLNQNNTPIQEGSSFFTIRSGNNPPAVFLMPQPY
jgi:hypothetical protein